MNQAQLPTKSVDTAFREGCALLDGKDFGVFSITGKDAKNFFHRMLSNEIRNLADGAGTGTCLLNVKGRVELYFHLWRVGDEYRVLIWGKQREEFITKLDRFLFTETVEMKDRSDTESVLMLCGQQATEALGGAIGAPVPDLEPDRSAAIPEVQDARLYRFDWTLVPVYILTLPLDERGRIHGRLLESGVVEADWSGFHTLRIEKGTPWPEFEVDDSTIPYECGLDAAVSLTKGCFVGQEIVARMKNLGESPRYLRAIVFEGPTPPTRGAEVKSGEIHAGRILTAGYSDRLGAGIGASSLLRKAAEPGTRVEVEGNPAQVRLFPL